MIWVDRIVKQLKERNFPLEWVDDMKTPSGRIHVGALRGVVIHDLIYKVLKENKIKSNYTYVFDDHDPMDAIPLYLNRAEWEKYSGMQLNQVPSPEKGFKNFAEFYAKEFQKVFESINCHPKIIWASELYNCGKMNGVIKEVLDGVEKIREIYLKITKKPKSSNWYPFNPKCEKCLKIGTTQVYKWDGEYVYYRCLLDLVEWAVGCGYEGKVSPFNGNGKIPWKVEWAAKWKVVGITVEGAGKDHMSKGGSHDIASAICREVLNYPVPYPIPYEWFTIAGRKMSSSKGVGNSAKEVSKILPSDIFRFLIVRTHLNTHLDFNPYGDTILNIFDDYDRCLNAYFNKLENKIPKGKQGEVTIDFARIIELSQVRSLPKKRLLLPRFRTITNLLKSKSKVISFFEKQKGSILTKEEKEILEERVSYAKIYLEKYSGLKQVSNYHVLIHTNFLKDLVKELESKKPKIKEEIQTIVFEVIKKGNYKPKEVFKEFYQVLMGKDFGPKAADLILEIGIENTVKKLESNSQISSQLS